jgi:hypothetical protein
MICVALYPDMLHSELNWDQASYYAAIEKGVISASDIGEGSSASRYADTTPRS